MYLRIIAVGALNSVQDRRRSPIEIRLAAERTNEEGAYVIMWWMRVRQALFLSVVFLELHLSYIGPQGKRRA